MMREDDYRHFVCIVAGDNPDELMKDYDKNKKVEPYIVYKYEDAGKLRKSYIDSYKIHLKNAKEEFEIDYIKDTIDELENMSDDDFFYEISDGLEIDENNGNAISSYNKEGKWSYYKLGKILSLPFLTKDGKEVFQARKCEIDWDKIHLNGGEIYSRAWEMVIDGSEPKDEYEKQIYENMKDKTSYFQKFETKENYIISNTAFWGYAFLSEITGWQDASDAEDQFVWMKTFYDLFIKNLKDDTLLTIFECVR